MSTHFEREVDEQPAALARLLTGARAAVDEAAAAVRAFAPRFIVTAARGSSDNAARYAKYLFGAHNQLVVSLGAPSLVTLYDAAPSLRDALVIGISQSGESPDIVALLEEGRRQGALTLALCNQPASPLARAAAHVIDLHAGPEQSVVASKSYTAELLALAMLSAAMGDDPGHRQALQQVPDAVARTLDLCRPTVAALNLGPFVAAKNMVVVGRGFNFATAFELALKIKETAALPCEAYATPDLLHGPFAMINRGFPALVLAPNGATAADTRAVVEALVARQAHVIVVSENAAFDGVWIRARLAIDDRLPEWLSPLTAVVPGQCFALRLAQARGLAVDNPIGLSKVTLTR
jgi:glucosamine--fructose-6-phosphate aminotransferase (isomerizing)